MVSRQVQNPGLAALQPRMHTAPDDVFGHCAILQGPALQVNEQTRGDGVDESHFVGPGL